METLPVPRTSPVPFLRRLPILLTLLTLLATALAGLLLTAPAAGAAEIRGEENVVVVVKILEICVITDLKIDSYINRL